MKKALFTLAVLVMAFGNMGFAQRNAHLKSNATANVLKHYGVRNETMMVPQIATWQTTDNVKFRTVYAYDEYEYYLNEEYTKIDEGDGWLDYYMITYEYDFSGNVIEALGKSAYGTDVMENDALASYAYDVDMLSEVIYQYWDGNDWVNETKEVYNYNGDVTTILYWDWNGTNWTSDELYTYTYDNNTIELVIQYMQGGAWQNDLRCTFKLDFDENITEILLEDWMGSQWEFHQKNVYHYEGGVYTSMTVEVDNGTVVQQFDYTYVDGNATHGECKKWTGTQMLPDDGELEMAYGYNAATKTYDGCEVDMIYFDVTGLNENAQAANVKVYPVPAENELIIQTEDFQKAEIYSLTGQKLMESLQTKLNVSALASGVYLLNVYDMNGNCASQRVVVK